MFTDNVLMRVSDVTFAFPPVLLAMAIAASLGPGLVNTALALIIVWWPIYARLMRAQVLSVKKLDHVEAAIVGGVRPVRLLLKHIMPMCWSPIFVNATMDVGQVILVAAGLSFIGLSAQPPAPRMGSNDLGRRVELLFLVDRLWTWNGDFPCILEREFPRRRGSRFHRSSFRPWRLIS